MLRRHPVLSTLAVVYGGTLCIVSFGQLEVSLEGPAVSFVVFLPLGALVVLLLGRERWRLALTLGILVCTWIELGRVVWHPDRGFDGMTLLANIAGTLLGGIAATLVFRASDRPRDHGNTPLSPLSQGPLRGLDKEIPPD